MTKRNMKIEINESQPLDDVVMELGRFGYVLDHESGGRPTFAITWGNLGVYDIQSMKGDELVAHQNTVALDELKQMT